MVNISGYFYPCSTNQKESYPPSKPSNSHQCEELFKSLLVLGKDYVHRSLNERDLDFTDTHIGAKNLKELKHLHARMASIYESMLKNNCDIEHQKKLQTSFSDPNHPHLSPLEGIKEFEERYTKLKS